MRRGELKQQTFFSYSSASWKFAIRAPAWLSSWWAPFFWLADGPLLTPCVFMWWRQRGCKLFGFSSYKGPNPILRTSLNPNHVPKAPSPNVIPLGAKFQQMNLEGVDTDIQSITPRVSVTSDNSAHHNNRDVYDISKLFLPAYPSCTCIVSSDLHNQPVRKDEHASLAHVQEGTEQKRVVC